MTADDELLPRKAIRRFDVFAEVNRLEALAEGRAEDEAKGHGIWLAKVVAGRRFGRKSDGADRPRRQRDESAEDRAETKFKHAGDELQTDETFDTEIVERMGADFYEQVFSPAIHDSLDRGERYEEFRDTIRGDWKPARKGRKT
jgi:hypothetical protein